MKKMLIELTDELAEVLDAVATGSRGAVIEAALRAYPPIEEKRVELKVKFAERTTPGRPWPKKKAPKKRK